MKRVLLVAAIVLAGALYARARSYDPPPPAPPPGPTAPLELRGLAPGFEYGRWKLPIPSTHGDSTVRFVRVDPKVVELDVRAASVEGARSRQPSAWAADYADRAAVAVINASMFGDDWKTSIGYLRVRGTTQNGAWAKEQNALLALHPVGTDVAALQNLGCADRDALAARYATLVQSIRMIGCDGKNVWAQEARRWSSALVGTDRAGRLLFLHTRSPYTMHDLVEMLLAGPLDLAGLHYGDGGPPAVLYVRGPGFEETNVGSYETAFAEHDDNRQEWELPNVLVARTR